MPETRPILRSGWMLCDNANSFPIGKIYTTEAEATDNLPPLHYHVRPVDVAITVRGAPPAPWCFVAPVATPEPRAR